MGDQRRFVAGISLGIRDTIHHHAEQFGDGVADGVLADGHDQVARIIAVDDLLERGLPADGIGIFRIDDAVVAHFLGRLHEVIVEQQHAFHLLGEMHVRQHRRIARGNLGKESAVKIEKPFQHLVVFFPEMHILERLRPTLYLPTGQALRVPGQADAAVGIMRRFEYLQLQRLVEKLAVHLAHIGLKQTVLPAIGEVGIGRIGRLRRVQCRRREDDEVVVQHADAGHSRRSQRPGRIQACFARQNQRFLRIGILLQHVGDDDLVHPVPHLLHVLRHLRAPHRASERVEDGLGCVVDDGTIELGAVPQRLAIQQQILRVHQQAVVVHQIVQVLRAVEKLVVFHALRHFQRDRAERGDDLARAGNGHDVFF